jgi:hypothetical protein
VSVDRAWTNFVKIERLLVAHRMHSVNVQLRNSTSVQLFESLSYIIKIILKKSYFVHFYVTRLNALLGITK